MEYAVSRDGTSLVTLHEGSDTTAQDEAIAQLEERLEDTADGPIIDWEIVDSELYEPPTGPFDPYTVAVDFTVTVAVEAEDAETAEDVGASAIEEALETAGVDYVSYTTDPAVSSA
ncbi:hypothetical protein ACYJ1Y_11985 [Natrialbaceae archaeon A-gly3]